MAPTSFQPVDSNGSGYSEASVNLNVELENTLGDRNSRQKILEVLKLILEKKDDSFCLGDKVDAPLLSALGSGSETDSVSLKEILQSLMEAFDGALVEVETLKNENESLNELIMDSQFQKSEDTVDFLQMENQLRSYRSEAFMLKEESSRLQEVLMAEVFEITEQLHSLQGQNFQIQQQYDELAEQIKSANKFNSELSEELLRISTLLAERETSLCKLDTEKKVNSHMSTWSYAKTRRRTPSLFSLSFSQEAPFSVSFSEQSSVELSPRFPQRKLDLDDHTKTSCSTPKSNIISTLLSPLF